MSGTRSIEVRRRVATAPYRSSANGIESASVRNAKCLPTISSIGQPKGLGGVGHEREDAVRVGAPEDVRRRLDEAAEARLLAREPGEEVRVRQRDGGLVGEALEQVQIVGLEQARLAGETASVPMTSPPGARSGAAAMPRRRSRLGGRSVGQLVRDARVGRVVERPDRHALLGGQAVDAAAERERIPSSEARVISSAAPATTTGVR